ncbi:MAG: ROK family protein [Eubacteriales bacterium]|nr:ROK family protein [Eubacteriales bacterium]
MKSIAVDFGGTRIKIALVQDGQILARQTLDARSQGGLAARLDDVAAAVKGMAGAADNAAGVGVAFPGIVDASRQRILTSNGKYADAADVDLVGWAGKAFGRPAVVENDANAALMGEHAYGAGNGCGDLALMILGTGVGTAAMIGGRLLRGGHHQAGCLGGHITVNPRGRRCSCGNIGCLEAQASTWALPLMAKEAPGYAQSLLAHEDVVDFLALGRCQQQGDKLAAELLEECVLYWSAGLVNLIHAYDPARVVLSGGVMRYPGLFERITRRAGDLAWTPWGKVDFRLAAHPEDSVLLGLHALVAGTADGQKGR